MANDYLCRDISSYGHLVPYMITCVFTKKVLLKVLVKIWHTIGVHLLVLVLPILFFHGVYVLVWTILFKSIVNNPDISQNCGISCAKASDLYARSDKFCHFFFFSLWTSVSYSV